MTNHAEVCYQDIVEAINLLPRPYSIDQVMEAVRESIGTYFETLPRPTSQPSQTGGRKSPTQTRGSPAKSPSANWQAIINSSEYGLAKYFPDEWKELMTMYPKINHLARISMLRNQIEQDQECWQRYTNQIRQLRPDLPAVIPARKPKSPNGTLETIITTPEPAPAQSDEPAVPTSKQPVAKSSADKSLPTSRKDQKKPTTVAAKEPVAPIPDNGDDNLAAQATPPTNARKTRQPPTKAPHDHAGSDF